MSRKIEDLDPIVQVKCRAHLAACRREGLDFLITSTYRDDDEQAALFAQGRTAPGNIVTNAMPGQSMHNYRLAYDVVPMRNGKPVWNNKRPEDIALWNRIGELGEAQGLEWAGRWKRFREMPHFQYTGGLTIADLKAGKRPK